MSLAWVTAARLRPWLPVGVLVVVVWLDLVNGQQPLLGLVVIAPLFAASLVGPGITAVYAALALAAGAALGVYNDLYQPGMQAAQWTRLGLIAGGGVLAVGAARARVRREARLADLLRVAEVAQRAILPPLPASVGGLGLAAHYESAAREASIGGDLYAVVPTPWGVRLLVGDVRGKGLDAVRLAAVLLGAFRERADEHADLLELAGRLDAAVRRFAGPEDFVTAVLAQVDPARRLTLLSCGHPEPLLVRDGLVVPLPLPVPAPPLGLGPPPAARHQAPALQLQAGDRLLLHTDGLTEARRPRDRAFFPAEELVSPALSRGPLDEGLRGVLAELLTWTGGHLGDDVALLAAEVRPARQPPAAARPQQHESSSTSPAANEQHDLRSTT